MKLVYGKDENGEDALLDESGKHQVMMAWEKTYMEDCIEALAPKGSVLEIGFGMAYSARALCLDPAVTTYTVVECSPVVWERFAAFAEEMAYQRPELTCHLIKGRWQDVLQALGTFDAIFFDDYVDPTTSPQANTERFARFAVDAVSNHLVEGGRMCWYASRGSFPVPDNEYVRLERRDHDVKPPPQCRYAPANGYEVPVLTKIGPCTSAQLETIFEPFASRDRLRQAYEKHQSDCAVAMEKWSQHQAQRALPHTSYAVLDAYLQDPMKTRDAILSLLPEHQRINGFIGCKTTIDDPDSFLKVLNSLSDGRYSTVQVEASVASMSALARCPVQSNCGSAWTAVLFLHPAPPMETGITLLRDEAGAELWQDTVLTKRYERVQGLVNDHTRWCRSDTIENRFNRLVVMEPGRFHRFTGTFGTSDDQSLLAIVYSVRAS